MNLVKIRNNFFLLNFFLFAILSNTFSESFKKRDNNSNLNGSIYLNFDLSGVSFNKDDQIKFYLKNDQNSEIKEIDINVGPNAKSKFLLKIKDLFPSTYTLDFYAGDKDLNLNKKIYVNYYPSDAKFKVLKNTITYGSIKLETFSINEKVKNIFNSGIIGTSFDTNKSDYYSENSLTDISGKTNLIIYDALSFFEDSDNNLISKIEGLNLNQASYKNQEISSLKNDGKKVLLKITDSLINKYLNNSLFEESFRNIFEKINFDGLVFQVKDNDLNIKINSFLSRNVKFLKNLNQNFLYLVSFQWNYIDNFKSNSDDARAKNVGNFLNSLDDTILDFVIINPVINSFNTKLNFYDDSGDLKVYTIKKNGAVEFYKNLIEAITINNGKNVFYNIPSEKIVIGLPSSELASKNIYGFKDLYFDKDEIFELFDFLSKKNINLSGFISYNLGFDKLNNFDFTNSLYSFLSINNDYTDLTINLDVSPLVNLFGKIDKLRVDLTSNLDEKYTDYLDFTFLNENNTNATLVFKNILNTDRLYKISIQGVLDPSDTKIFKKIESSNLDLSLLNDYVYNATYETEKISAKNFYNVDFSIDYFLNDERKYREVNSQKVFFSERNNNDYYITPVDLSAGKYSFRKGEVVDFYIKTTEAKTYKTSQDYIDARVKSISISINEENTDLPLETKKINSIFYDLDSDFGLLDISDSYNLINLCYFVGDKNGANGYIKNADDLFFSTLNDSINYLNKKGKKVLLAIKADTFDLTKTENLIAFKKTLIDLLDKYNFDGINFYFFDSENYKNIKGDFTGNVVARLIKNIVEKKRLKNPSFTFSTTFNYSILNKNLIQSSKNLSNYLIDFINEYKINEIDYLFVHLFENYGRRFLLKGYDLEDHFIGNTDCSFSLKDGIENFIPHAVWALTKGYDSINQEYKFLPFPYEKIIPVIPASIDSVNDCSLMQNLKVESLDEIFRKIYKNGGALRGLGVLDAKTDKNFSMGKKIANKLNLKFSDRNFLQNCSNISGSIKINLQPLSDETDQNDFASIENVFGEVYQVFPNIFKIDKFDYPYYNVFSEFNIPLMKDGETNGVCYLRNVPISFLLSAEEIDQIFTSNGYIVQDWVDAGKPYQWEIKPTYYFFINGLCNPKNNNIYKPIGPNQYKDAFFNSELGYQFPVDAIKNDQLVLNFSYTDKLSNSEKNTLNFEVVNDNENFVSKIYYYQFNEEKRNNYNYVTDNVLTDSAYYFPVDDAVRIKPVFSNDYNLKFVSFKNSKIDLDEIYNIRDSLPIIFNFAKAKINYKNVNAIYYRDIPGENGNTYILDIPDTYNVIIFSSLIKKDGNFKLKNGQYITYDYYAKNKDQNDPDSPTIDFTYCDGSSYIDINNNISVNGNDSNGFIDLTAPAFFKKGIDKIKKSGRKVLLSLGDLSNSLSISDLNSANDFVAALKNIIDSYGFNGIDLSIEAVTANDSDPILLANAIKEVVDYYKNLTQNFWLTLSIKYDYIFNDLNGFFASFINQIGGINYFDYISPRLFNSNEKDFIRIKYSDDKYYSQTNLFSSNGYNECGLGEYKDSDENLINRLSLKDFIPKLVWALTTTEGYSLNSNIFSTNIPANKFLIYIPTNEKIIDFCSDLQIIKPIDFDYLIESLNNLGLKIAGISSYEARNEYENNFKFGETVEKNYRISDNKAAGSLNTEILNSSAVKSFNFTIAPISDYLENFQSINNLKLILNVYSNGISLKEKIYNLNFDENGATKAIDFFEGDSYSYKILGLANPEKGVYYNPIIQSEPINICGETININCSFVQKEIGDLSTLNLTINNSEELNLIEQIVNYRSLDSELNSYLYVTDNTLDSTTYLFDLNDRPSILIYFKDLKINSINPNNFDVTTSLIGSGLTLDLENLTSTNQKINIGFYESDGILAIEDLSKDIYDAVIFNSLIRDEKGKYILSGGRYITYSDYLENKYEDEPDMPIIRNENPYAIISNDNLGFYDLSSPSYMKKRIELMKNEGQKVILSIGGPDISFKLNDNFDLENLIETIKNIIDLYGFDGINLNLKSPTIYDSNGILFAKVIKNVVDFYRANGVNFWLTYTGDYFYLQNNLNSDFNADTNFYSDLINYLGVDYFNYFCPNLVDLKLNPIRYNDGNYYTITNINKLSDLDLPCTLGKINSSFVYTEKIGLLKFIPIFIYALTTEIGNAFNENYFKIPSEKLIISLPVNWRDVKACSNLQVLSKTDLDSLVNELNNFPADDSDLSGLSISGFLLNKVSNDTFNLIKPSELLIKEDIDFNFSTYVKGKIQDLLGRRNFVYKGFKNKKNSIFSKKNKNKSFKSVESLLESINFLNAELYDLKNNLIKEIKIEDRNIDLEGLNSGEKYRLHIYGIGDPLTGEYRKPIDIVTPYLNDYQNINPSIFYEESLFLQQMDQYELYINSDDPNYKNYDLIFTIDDYSTKKLKLVEGLYNIPKGKNFTVNIEAPSSLTPVIEIKGNQIFVSFDKTNKLNKLSVLYWNLKKNNNAEYPKLSDIPSYYNVIIINDALNQYWNSPEYGIDRIEKDLYKDYPITDFIQDIKNIQSLGGKVLFSTGNTIESLNFEDRIGFSSKADDIFRGLLYTYSKYGFDGIDINLDLAEINSNFKINTNYNYFDTDIFVDKLIELMNIFEVNSPKDVSLSPKLCALENNKNFFGEDENPFIAIVNKLNDYFKKNNRNFLFACPNPYQGDSKFFYNNKYYELSFNNTLNEYLISLFELLGNKELLIENSLLDLSDFNLIALFPSYISIVPAFQTSDKVKEIFDYFKSNKMKIGYGTINSEYEYTYGNRLFYEINQWEQVAFLDGETDLKYKDVIDLDITLKLDSTVDSYFVRNLIKDVPAKCYLFKVDDSGNDIFIESFNLKIDQKYVVSSNIYLGNNYKLLVTGYAYPSGENSFYLEPLNKTFSITSEKPLSLNFNFLKSKLPKNKVNLILNSLDITKNKIKIAFYETDVKKINGYLYLNSPINNSYYFLNDKDLKLGFNFTNIDNYYYLSNSKYITSDLSNGNLQVDYYNENISL